MRVLHYTEGLGLLDRSGIGTAGEHFRTALSSTGVGGNRSVGATTLFGLGCESAGMVDEESSDDNGSEEIDVESSDDGGNDEEKSFRERVEEIRERRRKEREDGDAPSPEEVLGGGPGGGPGGMGGNPFAQMMSGMMGGGPGGPGGMGGGHPGAGGRGEGEVGNEELVREVRQLRDEVRDATRQLQRIAQALEEK
jgi:hypothetical protein